MSPIIQALIINLLVAILDLVSLLVSERFGLVAKEGTDIIQVLRILNNNEQIGKNALKIAGELMGEK
jgi:hypothetical protein